MKEDNIINTMINYYKILGVPDFASIEEIENAYQKLSIKLHPDANNNDKIFVEKYNEIEQAFQYLSNDYNRGVLDQYLKNNINNQSSNSSRPKVFKTVSILIVVGLLIGLGIYSNGIRDVNEEEKVNFRNQKYLGIGDAEGNIYNSNNEYGLSVGTTKEEIIDRYGFPDQVEKYKNGEIWHYVMHEIYFVDNKIKQVGNIDRSLNLFE